MKELEIYAPIPEFPNYLVTSNGRILNIKKGMKQLKAEPKGDSKRVSLSYNGYVKRFYVSKLVKDTFGK